MLRDRVTENISAGVNRGIVSAIAGVIPGLILASVLPFYVAIPVGLVLGAVYGVLFLPTEGSMVDHALNGASLSIPGWLVVQLTVNPYIQSGTPAWTVGSIESQFPELGVWMIAGTVLSTLVPVTGYVLESKGYLDLKRYRYREEDESCESKDILILGGGFSGLYAAKQLEKKFGPNPDVEIKLVSDDNSVLFTPMLPEVAGGTLEPTNVTVPLRTSLRRTEIREASVTDIDLENEKVYVKDELEINPEFERHLKESREDNDGVDAEASDGEKSDKGVDTETDGRENEDSLKLGEDFNTEELEYDELLLCLGAVPDHHGIEGIEQFAFDFKTIQDAMSIRNHVVSCLERAAMEDDPEVRKSLLTFVIAGGGFAGAELAGALNDLARGLQSYYPNVPEDEIDVVLVHSHERILPELSESLGERAKERMSSRGVRFVLDVYVEDADPKTGEVTVTSGESISTQTLVWTAGNQPNPLVTETSLPTEHGAVDVSEYLNVSEYPNVWASGDCAFVVDAESGEPHPPTAQHAIRESKDMASNVYRKTVGKDLEPHSYSTQGMMCVIGHRSACAEIGNLQFSGLFAWIMWRMIYLMKLPGIDRKIRVFFNWVVDFFFPPDIVQTLGSKTQEVLKDGQRE